MIIIGLIIALLIESPLIYSRIKDKAIWLPINSPPWMLGDDFYYFSILNNLHKKFLNKLHKPLKTTLFSRMVVFQSVGNILNLIPYHVGYLIEDKRLGVLFVKLWNRFLLFISVGFFSNEIFKLIEHDVSVESLIVVFLLYFSFYPGPLSYIYRKRGLIWNVFNIKHMFHYVHVNDLTRGMHSETTAPLLLLFVGFTLHAMSHNSDYLFLWVTLLSLLMFFQYFPAFIVYSLFSVSILFYKEFYFSGFIVVFLNISLSFIYVNILSKCQVSSELIAHNDGGKYFDINRNCLTEVIYVLISIPFFYFYFSNIFLILLYIFFSGFVFTHLLYKHQLNRFWIRGAAIVAQLIFIIAIVIFLIDLNESFLHPILGGLILAYFIYFYNNSKYLYRVSSTKIPNRIDGKKINNIFDRSLYGVNYLTPIIELAYYINLYTNNDALLKNYSIQSKGYKIYLRDICYNYKIVGYSLDELIKLLTTNPGDWRSLAARENISASYPYFHEAQYIATNYLFNQKIIDDGMYINEVWTDKYKAMLKDIWDSIEEKQNNDMVLL